jgi:hypothetical protein
MTMIRTLSAVGASLLIGACAPQAEEPVTDGSPVVSIADAPMPATAPLLDIMRGLADDMSGVLEGVWVADPEIIQYHATRIADHPKVSDENRVAIQGTLGADFPTFVGYDQQVHAGAVRLAEQAEAGMPLSDLLALTVEIEEGCVSCHEAFRERVIQAREEKP